jgi:DNA-binding PadR family transcriptional regulator
MKPPNPYRFIPLTPLSYQIMLALADKSRHGYGIIKEIEATTETAGPSTGALYIALQRLQTEGLIEDDATAAGPGDDARRKYYRLTRLGRQVATMETNRLESLLKVASAKLRWRPGGNP